MKITFYTQKVVKRHDAESLSKLSIRLNDGRAIYLKATSDIGINPNWWDEKSQCVKAKTICPVQQRDEIDNQVMELKRFIKDSYNDVDKVEIDSEWLKKTVKWFYSPERLASKLTSLDDAAKEEGRKSLVSCFKEYVEQQKISPIRKKNQWVIYRALQRFELFVRLSDKKQRHFVLNIDEVSAATLNEFRNYLAKEHEYREKYPEIFEQIPEKRKPEQRGHNTLVEYMTRLKAFYNWLVDTAEYTNNRPFKKYKVGESIYGDPIYPNIEELHALYECDMSDDPRMAEQRDAYVLQCCVGCRVGDYYRMTYDNIIGNSIQYVQSKTADRTLRTVTVPLNGMALEIIERHYDEGRKSIMPFVCEQDYNEIIKKAFKRAGLNRKVIVIDTVTTQPVVKELWETASSHMARRTLVGNLYENVKDPSMICPISGHAENSRAFNRYRHINREMQQELVDILARKPKAI